MEPINHVGIVVSREDMRNLIKSLRTIQEKANIRIREILDDITPHWDDSHYYATSLGGRTQMMDCDRSPIGVCVYNVTKNILCDPEREIHVPFDNFDHVRKGDKCIFCRCSVDTNSKKPL